MRLRAVPLTRDQANAYIEEHHRHHGRVYGHRFILAAELGGKRVGIVIGGRPRAHMIDQYKHVEVSRLCSDGSRNVCSFLYSKASRIAREWGFSSVFTAILESETGTSLKASGWERAYMTKGGKQDRPSRRRIEVHPTCPKQIWAPTWCIEVVRGLNAEQGLKEKRRAA